MAADVTCKCTYRTIRIYINDIVHIIIPRGPYNLQSWYEGDKHRIYKIEIEVDTFSNEYHYQEFETWKKVLELLDENLQT